MVRHEPRQSFGDPLAGDHVTVSVVLSRVA